LIVGGVAGHASGGENGVSGVARASFKIWAVIHGDGVNNNSDSARFSNGVYHVHIQC
jgi:hypothetical protein